MNKKNLYMLMSLLAILTILISLLAGCGYESKPVSTNTAKTEETTSKDESSTVPVDENAVVIFADPTFERYLRKAMGNMGGEFTAGDLEEIKQIGIDVDGNAFAISYQPYGSYETFDLWEAYEQALTAQYEYLDPNAEYRKNPILIESLEDLKNFPNLEALVVNYYGEGVQVKNLDFLKSLPNLQYFCSESVSGLTNLDAFGQCKELRELRLTDSDIKKDTFTDINALASCSKLKAVTLFRVADSSALLELPELEKVDIIGMDEATHQKLIEKGII